MKPSPIIHPLRLAGALALASALVFASAAPAQASESSIGIPGVSSTDQITVDAPLHRVFVLGDDSSHPGQRALTIIDSRTDTVVGAPIALPGGDFIASDYQTHRVFITDSKAAKVLILDGRTGAITGSSVKLSTALASLAVDPFAGRVFVMDTEHDLFTLDESGIPVRKMLRIPQSGTTLAIDSWSQKVYVPNNLLGSGVTVVDSERSTAIGTIPVSGLTGDIAVDPFDHALAVSTRASFVVIDTRTDTVESTSAMPLAAGRPLGVDILTHTFFAKASDVMVWTFCRGSVDRLPADNVNSMGTDYLLHKAYGAQWNRGSITLLSEWRTTAP